MTDNKEKAVFGASITPPPREHEAFELRSSAGGGSTCSEASSGESVAENTASRDTAHADTERPVCEGALVSASDGAQRAPNPPQGDAPLPKPEAFEKELIEAFLAKHIVCSFLGRDAGGYPRIYKHSPACVDPGEDFDRFVERAGSARAAAAPRVECLMRAYDHASNPPRFKRCTKTEPHGDGEHAFESEWQTLVHYATKGERVGVPMPVACGNRDDVRSYAHAPDMVTCAACLATMGGCDPKNPPKPQARAQHVAAANLLGMLGLAQKMIEDGALACDFEAWRDRILSTFPLDDAGPSEETRLREAFDRARAIGKADAARELQATEAAEYARYQESWRAHVANVEQTHEKSLFLSAQQTAAGDRTAAALERIAEAIDAIDGHLCENVERLAQAAENIEAHLDETHAALVALERTLVEGATAVAVASERSAKAQEQIADAARVVALGGYELEQDDPEEFKAAFRRIAGGDVR